QGFGEREGGGARGAGRGERFEQAQDLGVDGGPVHAVQAGEPGGGAPPGTALRLAARQRHRVRGAGAAEHGGRGGGARGAGLPWEVVRAVQAAASGSSRRRTSASTAAQSTPSRRSSAAVARCRIPRCTWLRASATEYGMRVKLTMV